MHISLTRRGFGAGVMAGAALLALPLRAQTTGGTLTFGLENAPLTLNPHIHNLAKTKMLVRNLYEPLLSRDAAGGFHPWLASGYEVSPDGLTYRFTLRPDVTFSDGSLLDAQTVALNFTRFADVDYTGPLSTGPISYLKQARADGDVVELELTEPYAAFLSFAAALELISSPSFDAPGLKAGTGVAGTGPFTLESYVPGQEITFARRDDYDWAPANAAHRGPAHLDQVVYRFLPESSVRVGALLSGQVDAIEGVSGNDAELFDGVDGFTYASAVNGGTPYLLFFNVLSEPTADVEIRKAISAAIDVDGILQSVYRGRRQRAWGIASPVDTLVYDAEIEGARPFDPALANRLLDDAGWARAEDGIRAKDGRRLVLNLIQNQAVLRDQRDVLLLAVQAQLRQNAGIEVVIHNHDTGTFAERRKRGDYHLTANSNVSAEGYGFDIHYLPFEAGGRNNASQSNVPRVQSLLAQARQEQDTRKRFEIYAEMQRVILVDEALNLPIYLSEDQIAAGAHVKGLGFRPYHQLVENAYDVWLEG